MSGRTAVRRATVCQGCVPGEVSIGLASSQATVWESRHIYRTLLGNTQTKIIYFYLLFLFRILKVTNLFLISRAYF